MLLSEASSSFTGSGLWVKPDRCLGCDMVGGIPHAGRVSSGSRSCLSRPWPCPVLPLRSRSDVIPAHPCLPLVAASLYGLLGATASQLCLLSLIIDFRPLCGCSWAAHPSDGDSLCMTVVFPCRHPAGHPIHCAFSGLCVEDSQTVLALFSLPLSAPVTIDPAWPARSSCHS